MPLPSQLPEDFIKKPSSTSVLVGNRYSIIKRIGSGNFGTAFLIEDTTAKNENDKKYFKFLFDIVKRIKFAIYCFLTFI